MKTPLDMKEGETLVKTYISQNWNWHTATVQILSWSGIHPLTYPVNNGKNWLTIVLTAEQVWSGIHPLTWRLHVPRTGIQPLSWGLTVTQSPRFLWSTALISSWKFPSLGCSLYLVGLYSTFLLTWPRKIYLTHLSRQWALARCPPVHFWLQQTWAWSWCSLGLQLTPTDLTFQTCSTVW